MLSLRYMMRSSFSMMKWGILALFFISGFPALLYQVIWQHHLNTIYGSNAESVAIIVGAFMFGLGFGSLLGGEVSLRFKHSPFYLFAIIETVIGIFGYLSLQLFDLIGNITVHLGLFGAGVCAFLLVIIPTVAMGATLPILANALILRLKNVGVSVGSLYFVNTLGSACAAWASVFLFHMGFGQHGAIFIAVLLNMLVVIAALCLQKYSAMSSENDSAESQEADIIAVDQKSAQFDRAHLFSQMLAFCSGFLALSVEILWFRIIFISNFGRAFAFPIALAFFLFGIAFGSLAVARSIRNYDVGDSLALRRKSANIMFAIAIMISVVFASSGYFAVSGIAAFLFLTTVALAFPLGMLFPLLMHSGVLPNINAGRSVSHIYAANILGSTLGSIGTGFILLNYLSLRSVTFLLSFLSLVLALFLAKKLKKTSTVVFAVVAGILMCVTYSVNGHLFEKLQFSIDFTPEKIFANVVENRSGVIGVTKDNIVFGTGVYDGRYSTDLVNDRNIIIRPYALSAFHADPKRILVIGLSSGSWAQVLTNHPDAPSVDIVEINPGYIDLIPRHDMVASLLKSPRVNIVIEDGRRFLRRNPAKKYDAIVMNTSFHWRAGMTNLLSRDFLEILRAHLNDKGVIIYNTTSSETVYKTGLSTFPYGWRLSNALVLSDSPIPIDRERLISTLTAYRIDGKPVLDLTTAGGTQALARFENEFDPKQSFSSTTLLEDREHLLSRLPHTPIVTDDNMLIEWEKPTH